MKKLKLISYIVLAILSIFVFFNAEPKKSANIQIEETDTFPPKEKFEELKDKEIQ